MITSYQKQKQRILELEAELADLKRQLLAKGNIFFIENQYLGFNKTIYGFVDKNNKARIIKSEAIK